VFTDVLNLVFQAKSAAEVSTGQQADTVNAAMKQREMINSKCLQFLRFLAR